MSRMTSFAILFNGINCTMCLYANLDMDTVSAISDSDFGSASLSQISLDSMPSIDNPGGFDTLIV